MTEPWPGAMDTQGRTERAHLLQAGQVDGHVAIGRRDHHGGALHDVVAGEDHALVLEQPTQVIGCMARRVHGPQREIGAGEDEAVAHGLVGREVVPCAEAEDLAPVRAARAAAAGEWSRWVWVTTIQRILAPSTDAPSASTAATCPSWSGPGSTTAMSVVPTR